MPRLRRLLLRLLNLFRPGGDADFARELEVHRDLLAGEFERKGFPPDAARQAAQRAMGDVDQAKALYRGERTLVWLDDARRDLIYAMRMLRRSPLFTLTAGLSLAIGMGANTAVFTVANAVLFRPPAAVASPGRLVDIGTSKDGNGFGPSSFLNYIDLRDRTTTLEHVYAQNLLPRAMSLGVSGSGNAERVFGSYVTLNYFIGLGAVPAAGRLFDVSDDSQPGAAPIAVLSHGFWSRRFNRDPSVVGSSVLLDGRPFTVVGVTAEGFHGTTIRTGDLWIPLSMSPSAAPAASLTPASRAAVSLLVGARLRPGVTFASAASELDVISRALEREHPAENKGVRLSPQPLSPVPGNRAIVAVFVGLLTVVASVVLMITCANIAGVLLARIGARRLEIAVRLAMGAGGARIVRQLLAETTVLFVLGGVSGLAVARAATSLVVSRLPALPFPIDVPLSLDGRVILASALLALAAMLLAGLVPALHASRTDVMSAMKDHATTPRSLRLRHAFVTAQVALSVLLIVVGGLFVRALQRAGSLDPGFEPRGVELATINLAQARYSDVSGRRFAADLLSRVRALPEVEAASLALALPGGFEVQRRGIKVAGATPPNGLPAFGVDWNAVEPGYFATLRIPLVAGRDFNDQDRAGASRVAIVGEAAARQFWPGGNAVGQYIEHAPFVAPGVAAPSIMLRVVGVVRDIKATSLVDGLQTSPVYVPWQQDYSAAFTIVARTTDGRRISDRLQRLIATMDPGLPIISSQTLEDSLALGLVPQRLVGSIAGTLGLVGLLLAGIGIYGLGAYVVTLRRHEIGIRMALGARRADLVGMVLGQGMKLTVIGAAIGLLLAGLASQVLSGFLFGLPPLDVVAFSGAALLLVLVGLAACYVPARRAISVDVMESLRSDG
jgi:predicted permease